MIPDPALRVRLTTLFVEGWELWDRFDMEVRDRDWHPFVNADYEAVLSTLLALHTPGSRFLEWGSATGIITIAADMLGFDAYGIELDPELVRVARKLARRHASRARFVAGSFVPLGYHWSSEDGDARMGTIGEGESAYQELGLSLDAFDVVYAYPWAGEEAMMLDLMARHGKPGATLLLFGTAGAVRAFRNGAPLILPASP